jgi:hypothetical protein
VAESYYAPKNEPIKGDLSIAYAAHIARLELRQFFVAARRF